MKKIPVILFILALSVISCKQEEANNKRTENTISITIDDRVELLRVAYFFSY